MLQSMYVPISTSTCPNGDSNKQGLQGPPVAPNEERHSAFKLIKTWKVATCHLFGRNHPSTYGLVSIPNFFRSPFFSLPSISISTGYRILHDQPDETTNNTATSAPDTRKMALVSRLLPLFFLFVFLGILGFIGFVVYSVMMDIKAQMKKKMEKKNMTVSR